MIYIFRMATGETIIGECNHEFEHLSKLDEAPYLTIYEPMIIEKDEGGMKLRDYLMLSDKEKLTFRSVDVISLYTPSEVLEKYYRRAALYAKKYTRPGAQQQIDAAIQDLEAAMQEEDENNNRLVNLLMKATGSTTLQ